MKQFFSPILLALTFFLIFTSTSFAEWVKVSENLSGDSYYLDFERIRTHNGYVYFWYLTNRLERDKFGDLSDKTYTEGDCNLFRMRWLDITYHTQLMGKGAPSASGVSKKGQEWQYPQPDSVIEVVLNRVCTYLK